MRRLPSIVLTLGIAGAFAGLELSPAAALEPPRAAAPSTAPEPPPADAEPDGLRRRSFNVDKTGLALGGWDPVSYLEPPIPKSARKGLPQFTSTYRGITYRFANAANKATFDAEPAKYEPPFGGWCAWAVIDGDKVEVDPANFEVIDGRVYLFYKGWLGNARNDWDKRIRREGAEKTVAAANAGWAALAKKDAEAYEKEEARRAPRR